MGVHHFLPKVDCRSLDALIPYIDQVLDEKSVHLLIGYEELAGFKEDVLSCMEVYYQLLGRDDGSTESSDVCHFNGPLPRYVDSLIHYFRRVEQQEFSNKEAMVLEYSGVKTIKIRYKQTNSVIKKLVKLGLREREVLKDPLSIFLKDGALHDLVGILFICSYPYEKEWVARALYNFFEYKHRTDDHLLYGFYNVKKRSGYQALHCDRTIFDPRFDLACASLPEPDGSASIFTILDSEDDDIAVIKKLKDRFNIEIQLHTTLENVWGNMEHSSSYDVLAKGTGRSSEITVQWKLLSDSLKELELKFQRLQMETEQSRYKDTKSPGFTFVYDILKSLDKQAYTKLIKSVEKVDNLIALFNSHEFSRHDYVQQLQEEMQAIDAYAARQKDITVHAICKMQSAFIAYGLANHSDFFNPYDIREFVQSSLDNYEESQRFVEAHPEILKQDLVNILSIYRYLRLGQKYGLGLMDPPADILSGRVVPVMSFERAKHYFALGLSLLNSLSEDDLHYLKDDGVAYVKILHHFDVMAREWELFSSHDDSGSTKLIIEQIARFRGRFINEALLQYFKRLLDTNKIDDVGLIVDFYATMIWHGLYLPIDSIKQIIRYSGYSEIDKSDLFYYELAAYRFLVVRRCELLKDCDDVSRYHDKNKIMYRKDYHSENMINLLFQIKRKESFYTFEKARIHFEKLTGSAFKIDHFSDSISQ